MKMILPVFFINPDEGRWAAKKHHVVEELHRAGFTSITHVKSTTIAYPRCLCEAIIEGLQLFRGRGPVLMVEDDIRWTGRLIDSFPEDAYAVYLGFSECGASYDRNIDDGPSKLEPYSESFARVTNMLSGHAILFVSERYKEAVHGALQTELAKDIRGKPWNDVLMARLHKDFRIYAPIGPCCFYQAADLGGNELTKLQIVDLKTPRLQKY